jgi:hypothetical protein
LLGLACDRGQVVFVLSGMGGVGKSELVLQFLKTFDGKLRKRYLPLASVFGIRSLMLKFVQILGCLLDGLQ